MIQIEYPFIDNEGKENYNLIKRFSDKNVLIHKIGTDEFYDAAIDIVNATFEYEETNKPINGADSDGEVL